MSFLKAFNPHELAPHVVLGVATGREEPLSQIISTIRANLHAPVMQHVIISAPRGYGKSFFLRYLEIKVAEIAAREQLPISMALLPEELPHVKEPDTLISEIRRTLLKAPADSVGVRWVEDDGQAWDLAVTELHDAITTHFGSQPGLLVVGIENFDLLVKKVFSKGIHSGRLRELLTRQGNLIMLVAATARGAFDRDYDLPLFKAFDEISLTPWTVDECLMFFKLQRTTANKAPLSAGQQARAKAVATFIDGNPRLATLIGETLLEDDPIRAAEILERLVDELTPYYKERIEALSARSQLLLDALLRGGERCSATELARRVGAPAQSAIAGPLDDLKRDRIVTGEKAPDSAEVLHRVTDRVLTHYYRKRILSHGTEICPLEALVDLLAEFYSPEEKKIEATKLEHRGLLREAAIMRRLWEADQTRIKETLITISNLKANTELLKLLEEWNYLITQHQWNEAIAALETTMTAARTANNSRVEIISLTAKSFVLAQLSRHEEAIAVAREAMAKADLENYQDMQALARYGLMMSLDELRQDNELLTVGHEATKKADHTSDANITIMMLELIARAHARRGQTDNAISALRHAVTKTEHIPTSLNQADILYRLSHQFGSLKRYEDALVLSKDVIEKTRALGNGEKELKALQLAAKCLIDLKQYDNAIVYARDAVAKAETLGDLTEQAEGLGSWAWSLGKLNRHEEQVTIGRDGAHRAERIGDLSTMSRLLRIVSYGLAKLDRDGEAIATARQLAILAERTGDSVDQSSAAALLLIMRVDDVGLALRAYELLLADDSLEEASPIRYFDDIAYIVTVGEAWPNLINLLQRIPAIADRIIKSGQGLGEPGIAISKIFGDGDHEGALKALRHFVTALAAAVASHSGLKQLYSTVLDASVRELISKISEPTLLRDIATILAAHPIIAASASRLVDAVTNYHTRGRDAAALARLEPDLATTLTAIFPPTKVETKSRKLNKRRERRT